MKVVYLIPNLGIGGPQRLLTGLLLNSNENFEVSIISLWANNSILSEEFKNSENIIFCSRSSEKTYCFSISILLRLMREIKRIEPDVVHSHLWAFHCIYLYFVRIALWGRRTKYFHTLHSSGGYFTGKKISERVNKFIELTWIRIFRTQVVAISKETYDMAHNKFGFSRICLINNGVDVEKYSPNVKAEERDDFDMILCFAARYQASKGHKYLIDAIKILSLKGFRIRAYLIGGQLEDNYGDYCQSLGIVSDIVFTGDVNNVVDYLHISDIGVFPSLYEGFPIALCEMMSCGLPIVASDIESIREATLQGEGALLVPVESPEAIANGLIDLHSNKNRAKLLGERARNIICENFSFEKFIKKHIDAYLL